MELLKQLKANKRGLLNAFHYSLISSAQNTVSKCKLLGNKPEEPDFIADLVINWTNNLNNILNFTFNPKITFGIGGVFCHQKPIVKIGTKKNPELGDLLLVF